MKRELSSEHRLPSNVNPSLYLPITLVFALAGTQAEDFKPLGFDKAAGWGKVQLPERAKSELGKRDEAGLNQLLAEAAKLNADKFSIGQIISRIAAEEIKAAGEDQARVIEIWRWMAGARMRRYDMAGGRALIHKTLLGHSAKQDEAVLTELGNCVDLLARFGSDVGDIWPMLDLIEQRFGNAGDDAKAKIWFPAIRIQFNTAKRNGWAGKMRALAREVPSLKEEIPEVAVETRKGKRFYFGDQAVVSSATVEVVRGAMALARAGQHEPAVQRLQEALSSEGELLFSDTNEPARVVSLANSIQALVATDPELSRAYETSYAAPARSRFDEAMHYYTGGYAMTSLGHFARLEREYPLSSYSRKARLLQAGLYADIGKTAHAQHLLSQAADDPLTPVADRATALVWQAALDERSARESKKRMAPLLRELKPDAGFLRAGRKITFADWADLKDRVKTSRPRQTAMPAAGKLVADIEIRAKSHADRSYPDAVGSAVVFYDGQTVRCFDTDKLEWRWEAAGPGSGFPTGTPGKPVPLATTENRVFVTLGLADGWGTLVAFDLTLGEAYWSTKYQGSYAGLTFVSPPSILDDRLFVLARDARSGAGFNETLLLCIDAATGENIWRKALVSGSIGGAERMLPGPLAFGGSVGVFVHTGHWMTIDVETGEYQGIYTCRSGGWSFSNISGRSLATSQLTILLTGNGKLLAVDNLANSVRWLDDRSGISRLIGLAGDRLIYSAGDRVRAVDSKTGLLHWEVATAPGQSAEAILHGGSLRVAGVDGNQLQIDVSTGEVKKLNVPIYRGPGVVAGDGIVRVWRDGLTATRPKVTLPPAQHWKRTAMVHLVKRVVRNDEGYDRSRDLKELFTKGGQPEKALAHLLTMEDARRSGDQALAKASTRALLGMSKDVMTLSDGRIISPAVSGRLFDSFPKKTDAPVLETDSTGALVPLWSVPGAGITAGPNPDGTFVAIRRGTQVQLRLADERGSLVWARNFEDVPSIYWARSRLLILVGKELHSLDLRDSSMIWRRENCERIFVHPSSSVVVTQEGGKILGIDSASGEQLWDVEHAGVLHGHHFRDTFVLVSSGLRVLDVQTGGTRLQTGLALRKPDFTEDVPVLMHRDGNSIFCVRGDRGRAIEYDVERKRLVWSKVLRRMDGTSRLMSDENFFVISSDFASAARVAVIDRQKSGMFLSDQPSASAVSLNQGIIAYERFSGLGLMEVKSGYRPRLKRNVKHVLPGNAYRNFIIDENWVVTSRRGTGQWHFCLYRPQDIRITSQFALRDLPQSFAICGGLLLVGTPSDLVAFAAPEEKGIAPSTALEKAARAAGDAGEIAREMIAAKKPGEVDLFVTSTEIKPDGNLSDWQGLPVLKFGGNHYNALPPSTVAEPSREHRGDKDLSAEISICEDERSVFIGAAIRDDIHRPAHTWPLGSGDCLHVEMASAVGEEGARTIQRKAWTFVVDGEKSLMSAEPSSEIRFAGRRQGDKTIYEAAIPHSLAGSMTFLNITASDRDGRRVHGITSLAPVRPTSPGRRYYAVVKRINDVVGSADRSWKLLKLFPEANDAPRLVETIVRLIPSANPFDQMVKVHRDAIAIYPGSRWTPHFLSRIEASLQAKGVANGIDGTLKTAQSLKVPKVALDLYQAAPRLSQRMWIDKHQPTHRLEVRLMEDRSGTPFTWGRIYWSPRPDVPSPVDAVYMGKLPAEGKWNTLTANLLALPQKSSKVGGITYFNRLGKVIWGETALTGPGQNLVFGRRNESRGEDYWGWYWFMDEEMQGHTTPFQLHGFWLQGGFAVTSVPTRTRPQEIDEDYRARLLEAHRLCGNSPAGRSYLQRLLDSLPKDKAGYARRFALVADYLNRTPNGAYALQLAHAMRGWTVEGHLPGGPERIAALLREAGTDLSLRRTFHRQYTAVPTNWQVLGPLDGDIAGWTRRTRVPRSRGGSAPVRIGRKRFNWRAAENLVKGRLVTPTIQEEDQTVFMLTEFQCKLGGPASLFLDLGHDDMQIEVFLNGRLFEQVVAYRDGLSAVIPVHLRFGRNNLVLKLGLSARSISARKDLPFTTFIASEDGASISTIEYNR